MENLLPVLAILGLAAVGVLGDYFLKIAGMATKFIHFPYFFIGMGLYASTAIGWFYVMKHEKFEDVGVFYGLTTVILLALVGAFVFKEPLEIRDLIGITLGIVSLVILYRFH